MPVHVLCIAKGITTTAQQWSHQVINHTLKLVTASETLINSSITIGPWLKEEEDSGLRELERDFFVIKKQIRGINKQ
jgi:hypothetical protein